MNQETAFYLTGKKNTLANHLYAQQVIAGHIKPAIKQSKSGYRPINPITCKLAKTKYRGKN